jgi:hypothetical protein
MKKIILHGILHIKYILTFIYVYIYTYKHIKQKKWIYQK